jgi:two-component system, NarL family, nitrate/nitrite response regulator NarL
MEPIRVLLVEDNEVYRDSLAFLLARHEGLEVVGAVGTAEAAPRASVELEVDVAVVDYRLPDQDGGEAAAAIRERRPETAIVFLSASAGDEEHAAARDAGVALIRKDEGLDTLVGAVRAAAGRGGG